MVAGGYAALSKPVYVASALVRIGHISESATEGNQLIESAEVVALRLATRVGKVVEDDQTGVRAYLASSEMHLVVPGAVLLTVKGDSGGHAHSVLQDIVDDIRKAHDELLEINRRPYVDQLERLDAQIAQTRGDYERAGVLIDELSMRDPVQASLVILSRGQLGLSLREMEAERPTLAQRLLAPQMRPTEVLGEIATPSTPSRPRTALLISISAALGAIAGAVLAMIVEVVATRRHRRDGD